MNSSFLFLGVLFSLLSSVVLETVAIRFWEPRWATREILACTKPWYRSVRIVFSTVFGSLFSFVYESPITGIAFASFAWLVLTVIDTDLKSKKIPREPCWTVFFVSTIIAFATIYSVDNAIYGIGSAIIFGGAFFAVAMISRGGLGSGDVRLIIALSPMGWWFGFYPIMLGLMVAFLMQLSAHLFLFLFYRKPDTKRLLPFGPALGIGLLVSQIWFSLLSETAIF